MIKEAALYSRLSELEVECMVCAHNCRVRPAAMGVCGVRVNSGGRFEVNNYAELVAVGVDLIEKKPLYHFLPGSKTYSVAIAGCNFKCAFCQNLAISWQYEASRRRNTRNLMPSQVVSEAVANKCESIAYTYSEPTVFLEYVYDTAKLGRQAGLRNVFVTNGFFTEEAFSFVSPYIDAYNIDLKSFNDEFYSLYCGGRLKPVLDSIERVAKSSSWLEVTTLVIPGKNDEAAELRKIAKFIASIDKSIPWHISAFYPCSSFSDVPRTPKDKLKEAFDIGISEGLKYVYLGNVRSTEKTVCSICGKKLIARSGYDILSFNVNFGVCAFCGAMVDGVFF